MADMPETRAPESEKSEDVGNSRASWAKAGIAVGIGSAALAAALLYANRPKKDRQK